MEVARFVDISSFQGSIDFSAYCAWAKQWDGISRIAIKATEGVGFTDPHFQEYRAGALAAGIDVLILYHFGYPDLGNAAADEARSFASAVGPLRPQDMVILDYEVESVQATAQWALDWLETAKELYVQGAGIYSSFAYALDHLQDAGLAAYTLWLADWTYNPDARPPCPPPWTSYEAVQYTDRATNIPGIPGEVDCSIFLGGGTPVQQYTPNSVDFGTYFTVDATDNWICKQTNAVIIGGNLSLYQRLSIDSNTLPVIGLPLESEQYHTEADGYHWSSQMFERATMHYDPTNRFDNVPGMGTSYLAHQAAQTQTVIAIPTTLRTSIDTIADNVAAMQKVADGLPTA